MNTSDINLREEITHVTFNYIINNCTTDSKFKRDLALANVLIIPINLIHNGNYGVEKQNIFPTGTIELYRYLQHKATNEIILDIATKDEDYLELAQHSDLVNLPTFLVSEVLLSLVINLISNYIYDYFKGRKIIVRSEIIISDSEGNNKSIKYEGPADQYNNTLSMLFK